MSFHMTFFAGIFQITLKKDSIKVSCIEPECKDLVAEQFYMIGAFSAWLDKHIKTTHPTLSTNDMRKLGPYVIIPSGNSILFECNHADCDDIKPQ